VRRAFEKDRVEMEEAHRKRGAGYFIPTLLYSRVQSITEISVLLLVSGLDIGGLIVVAQTRRGGVFAVFRSVPARAMHYQYTPYPPFWFLFPIFPLVA